jgi:hypothetical protein
MRSILGFFSMLALGLMIAAALVASPSGMIGHGASAGGAGVSFDYVSVIAGLGIGLLIAVLGQIAWGEALRRLFGWLAGQARRIALLACAAGLVAVLIYF